MRMRDSEPQSIAAWDRIEAKGARAVTCLYVAPFLCAPGGDHELHAGEALSIGYLRHAHSKLPLHLRKRSTLLTPGNEASAPLPFSAAAPGLRRHWQADPSHD
jgi:hypothetical protein